MAESPLSLAPLSLCLIVKDEEKLLPSCLESARPWVSEMIVVDTGSSDHTVTLAKSAGAQVEKFVWRNHFAEARNFAASFATQDWILFLDADEVLLDKDWQVLHDALRRAEAQLFTCVHRTYTQDPLIGDFSPLSKFSARPAPVAHFAGFVDGAQTRAYRRERGLVWERRIHETILPSSRRLNLTHQALHAVIHHLSALKDARFQEEKKGLYLRLMLERLSEEQDQPAAWFEMGLEWARHGRAPEAEKAYRQALMRRPQWEECEMHLAISLIAQNKTSEAQPILEILTQRHPQQTDFRKLLEICRHAAP